MKVEDLKNTLYQMNDDTEVLVVIEGGDKTVPYRVELSTETKGLFILYIKGE